MRISSIRITNFRALRDFRLDEIPDLAVLAGPNGTGKSTVLEAIALWKEGLAPYTSARKAGPDAVSHGADYAEIELSVRLADAEVTWWIEELQRRGQASAPLEANTITGVIQIRPDGQVTNQQWLAGGHFHQALRELNRTSPMGIMEYIGPYRRLPPMDLEAIPLTPITADRERATRVYDVESKFNEVKQYLIALEVRDWQRYYDGQAEKEDSSKEVKDLFEVFFAPKKLIGARSIDTAQGLRLRLLVETPAGLHDINNLSSGEKEILMVFATLHRLQLRDSVLLYDEPELHLNAAIERKVVPELSKLGRGNQIWVATHSVQIIDSTPLESLFVLSHYADGNQVTPAATDTDRITLFKVLGASTGLQLISDRVVFIEGEDSSADKEILEELFADHRHQISFVPSGPAANLEWVGRRGVELWQQASKHGQFFLIRDRDFMPDDQVQALQQNLNGQMWVWSRYHIENFLLEPTAIHRALDRCGVHAFSSPKQLDTELKSIADSLKDETIARWVGADLNRETGSHDMRITGGSDPLNQLIQAAEASVDRASRLLSSQEISKRVAAKQATLADWDAGRWRELVPGKRLLRLFVGRLHDGIPYERLRSLIVAQMRDDSTLWPDEFGHLVNRVLVNPP